MAEELTENEFYKRELAQNETFKYLNSSQRSHSYKKYLAEMRQAEETRQESAHKNRLEQERKAQDNRQAENLMRSQIKEFGQLQSAKIARRVTSGFDASEILELIDFFESQSQVYEAVVECHAKLEPDYRREILSWCLENTDLGSEQLEHSDAVDEIVNRCMLQGLSAVCKTGALGEHLGQQGPFSTDWQRPEGSNAGKIERRRSWKEISTDGD